MSDIGKGDWVLAVHDSFLGAITAGRTYYVEGLVHHPFPLPCTCGDQHATAILILDVSYRPPLGFCHKLFKPLGGGEVNKTEEREKTPKLVDA